MCISSFSEITNKITHICWLKNILVPRTLTTEAIERSNGPQPKGFALIPGEKSLPIPQREKRRKSYGATWQSFHFISIDEPYLGFKNKRYILLFSYLENLYHAKGRGRYVRTPYGVHFAVFPFYMPLVNENLDFKITNIKTRFFTKMVINSCFYAKIC